MQTFSQLVDTIVNESRRVDRVQQIADYVNQTIRSMHATPSGAAVFFPQNLIEDQLTASTDSGFSWTPPLSPALQKMRTVRFDNVYDPTTGGPVYPKFRMPSRALATTDHYYYRAGKSFFFHGYGGAGALISIAYYAFLPTLRYYPEETRPAWWTDSGWAYHPDYDQDEYTRAHALEMVTNWMIIEWEHTVKEGTLAKLWKAVKDEERARLSYSLHQTQLEQLFRSAETESFGV